MTWNAGCVRAGDDGRASDEGAADAVGAWELRQCSLCHCVMGWGCACPGSDAPRDGFCMGASTARCDAARGRVLDAIEGSRYVHQCLLPRLSLG